MERDFSLSENHPSVCSKTDFHKSKKKRVATWTIILEWSAISEPGHFSYNWLVKVMVAIATKYKFRLFDNIYIQKTLLQSHEVNLEDNIIK